MSAQLDVLNAGRNADSSNVRHVLLCYEKLLELDFKIFFKSKILFSACGQLL
jgi:hypothetical protein